eukprot:1370421-Amorphochlora_amoeboformis.AAC.2
MADSDIDSVEPLQESELRLLAKLKGQEIEVGKESEGSKPMKKSVLDVVPNSSKEMRNNKLTWTDPCSHNRKYRDIYSYFHGRNA